MNYSYGNTTDFLITEEQYQRYKNIIFLICLPVIAVIGIVGNSLSLYILQKFPTKHAFTTYVKVLTGIDTALLFISLLRSLFKLFQLLDIKHAAKIETYGNYFCGILLGGFLQRLSSTFITVISLERCLAVFFPFRIRTMFIEAKPMKIIAILICFHLVLKVPAIIIVEVKEVRTLENTTLFVISRTKAASQQPALTMAYLFATAIVGLALPLCFVLVTTFCIIIRIRLHQTKKIIKYKVCKGSLETERMTMTLIILVIFFSVTSVPAVFIYIWSAIDRSVENTFLRLFFVDINIITICLNSGSDFIVYCLASKSFRTLFFKRVTRICRGTNQQESEVQGDAQVIETVSQRQEESDNTTERSDITVETSTF